MGILSKPIKTLNDLFVHTLQDIYYAEQKITKALPKDGACKAVDHYSLTNTMSGFDATSGAFAFQITASDKDTVCFSHEMVVTLK